MRPFELLPSQSSSLRIASFAPSSAAGIYVNDIVEAVPIDKYFELFKPKNGGDGGFIRVAMNFSADSPEDAAASAPPSPLFPLEAPPRPFAHRSLGARAALRS